MVQVVLTKYWVLAHLLVMAGTLCFCPTVPAFGGLWCAVSLVLMALCLPPVHKGESFWMARTRVWERMRGDVVFWGGLLAAGWVAIGLLNGPRTALYSAELKRWIYSAPPLAFLPSAIEPGVGVGFWCGLVCGLAGAAVVRGVLPRSQRLYGLLGLGVLSGLVVLGATAVGAIAGEAPAMGWLGGAFGVGCLAFLMFCVGVGIVGESFLEGRFKTLWWALGVVAANGLGLAALAPAVIFGGLVVVGVVYLCFTVFAVRGSGRFPRVLWYSVLWVPVVLGIGLGLALRPGSEGAGELWMPAQWAGQVEAFFSQWSFRADLAVRVLGAEPMLGTGPEGFGHYGRFFVKGSQAWRLWRAGGVGLPCDLLRLLVERGLMGGLFLLLPGAAMLGRCLMKWVEFRQGVRRHYSLRYIFVFSGAGLGVFGVLLASLIGTPLHTPAVLCVFLIVCATLSGWMPRAR